MIQENVTKVGRIAQVLVCLFCAFATFNGGRSVLAQGSVSGVSVTTSVSSVSVPITTAASYGASVTDGTPQPDQEWQVIGSATYLWSASLGTPNPNNTSETTVTTPSLQYQSGVYTSTVTCTVSYQVQKSDAGQPDDGQIATISGHDTKSVAITAVGISKLQYLDTLNGWTDVSDTIRSYAVASSVMFGCLRYSRMASRMRPALAA